jgi:hypothetical protein
MTTTTNLDRTEQLTGYIDGFPCLLRVVIPEPAPGAVGWPEVYGSTLYGDVDMPVLSFDDTKQLEALADELLAAADRCRAMWLEAQPVVIEQAPGGLLQARAGWLVVRRVEDDRAVINGRPFGAPRIGPATREGQDSIYTVPRPLTVRDFRRQAAAKRISVRDALPRLYDALRAAERSAQQ